MPSRSNRVALVDTSIAVALSTAEHPHRAAAVAAVAGRRLGLAGHAAFETFSVLTRMPVPERPPLTAVAELIAANFPETRHLSAAAADRLIGRLSAVAVGGGAVYDALVASAALEAQLPLLTRDKRALPVYRALEVAVEVVT